MLAARESYTHTLPCVPCVCVPRWASSLHPLTPRRAYLLLLFKPRPLPPFPSSSLPSASPRASKIRARERERATTSEHWCGHPDSSTHPIRSASLCPTLHRRNPHYKHWSQRRTWQPGLWSIPRLAPHPHRPSAAPYPVVYPGRLEQRKAGARVSSCFKKGPTLSVQSSATFCSLADRRTAPHFLA